MRNGVAVIALLLIVGLIAFGMVRLTSRRQAGREMGTGGGVGTLGTKSGSEGKVTGGGVEPQGNYPELPGLPAQKKVDTSGLVAYQVWLNSYAQSAANGQTSPIVFENAAVHLPELSAMGVNLIQLSPVHPFGVGTTIGSPYGSRDYYDVQPGYAGFNNPRENPGTRDERIAAFKKYVDAAHAAGMKVIMDCVYHSTDPKNVLMTSHPEFYKRDASGNVVTNNYGFAVLDYSRADVRKYMIDMVKYWETTVGVDGCRADVAIFVPLPFWAMLNNELKKMKPDWLMVAETGSKLREYGGVYSGTGYLSEETYSRVYGFDALYGVNYMLAVRKVLNQNGSTLDIGKTYANPDPSGGQPLVGTVLYRGSDNHDQRPRVPLLAGGNPGLLAAMALNFSIDGLPFIFNGQEIGDTSPVSIANQTFIAWNNPPHSENREVIKRLSVLRKAHPALNSRETFGLTTSDENKVLSFVRTGGGEKIVVVVNLSPSRWNGKVSGTKNQTLSGKLTDLLSGKSYQDANDSVSLSLEPYSYVIAKVE